MAAAFEVPGPAYQARGVTHKEEAVGNPGDPERHAIMVDLKDVTSPAPVSKPGLEPAFPREGAKDVIDNARVRFWDYTWEPNHRVAQHVHATDSVEIFVSDGTVVTKFADGHEQSQAVHYGYTRFVPRGQVDSEEANSGSPPRSRSRLSKIWRPSVLIGTFLYRALAPGVQTGIQFPTCFAVPPWSWLYFQLA